MSNRYAVLNGTSIENVILADAGFSLQGRTLVPDPQGLADIGGSYAGGQFYPPVVDNPPPPTEEELRSRLPELTPRQFNLMLIRIGMDWEDIQAQINAIPDPVERKVADIEFNRANSFKRLHPLVVQLGAAMEFPPYQLDALWAEASAL